MLNRRLITGERIMYVDKQTTVNCVFPVTVQGIIREEALRSALKKICQRHPVLQAVIRENKKGVPYFQPASTTDIPLEILHRETATDWKKVAEKEWHRPFDRENGPLLRITWIKGSELSELLITCPHFLVDGTSCQTLMRELLQHLDEPDKPVVKYETFNGLQELIPEKQLKAGGNILKGKIISGIARGYFLMKSRKKAVMHPNDASYMLHWKLGKEESKVLSAYSRQQESSIYTLCITAFLEAFQQVLGEKQAKGKVICPVDIRRYLPAIKEDHLFAFAPITELSIRKMSKLSFIEKSKALKKSLLEKVNRINIQSVLMVSESMQGLMSKMIRHMRTSRGSHDITFSNMGRLRIPSQFKTFKVKAIYSPSVAFPWHNPNTLVLSFFDDELDFAFMSREDFLSRQRAEAIKDTAMDALLKASNNKP